MNEIEQLRAQLAEVTAAAEMHDFLLQNLFALNFMDRQRDFDGIMAAYVHLIEQPPDAASVGSPERDARLLKHLRRFQGATTTRIAGL